MRTYFVFLVRARPTRSLSWKQLGLGLRRWLRTPRGFSELGRAGLVTTIALEASAEQIRGYSARSRRSAAYGAAPAYELGRVRVFAQLHHLYCEIAT